LQILDAKNQYDSIHLYSTAINEAIKGKCKYSDCLRLAAAYLVSQEKIRKLTGKLTSIKMCKD
jgi:hypothetical protein